MKKCFQLANRLTARDDTGMIRQFLRLLFIAGITGLLALAVWPYHDGALRYGLPLALTADGRHVMIYLRDGKWIQSDPLAGKVIVGHAERDPISWFTSLVTMHRWAVLE